MLTESLKAWQSEHETFGNIRIRGATPLDYVHLSEIAHANFDTAPNYLALDHDTRCKFKAANTPERIARLCGLPLVLDTLVAEVEKDTIPVGFTIIGRYENGRARIERLHVHPDHLKKGIGKALVNQAEMIAQQQGFTTLFVYASGDSYSWYERIGFFRESTILNDAGVFKDNPEEFHVMVKSI